MTVGTITGLIFDQYRNGVFTITGINGVGLTPGFRNEGFTTGSWQTTGLAATGGFLAGLWGSNDGTNYYQLQGATGSDDFYPLTTQGNSSIGSNVVPLFYAWNVTGTGTGSFEIIVTIMSTFG